MLGIGGRELDADGLTISNDNFAEDLIEVVDGEADVRVRHLLGIALKKFAPLFYYFLVKNRQLLEMTQHVHFYSSEKKIQKKGVLKTSCYSKLDH